MSFRCTLKYFKNVFVFVNIRPGKAHFRHRGNSNKIISKINKMKKIYKRKYNTCKKAVDYSAL